jgi:hypothetical protein
MLDYFLLLHFLLFFKGACTSFATRMQRGQEHRPLCYALLCERRSRIIKSINFMKHAPQKNHRSRLFFHSAFTFKSVHTFN